MIEWCVKDLKMGEEKGKETAAEINAFLDRDEDDVTAADYCDYLRRARPE